MSGDVFRVGTEIFLPSDSPDSQFGVVFEEDDATGYIYALTIPEHSILDAVHIYDIAAVVEKDRPSTFEIVWAENGIKCALLINDYPHAAFDFEAKRGYCRTNFPNFPDRNDGDWTRSDHSWSDDAVAWLSV